MVNVIQVNLAKRMDAASNLKLQQNNTSRNIGIAMIQEPAVRGLNVIGLLSGEVYSQVSKGERTRAAIWVRKDVKNQFCCEMVGSFTTNGYHKAHN